MATIYRGRDTKLGRDVAIKVLRGEYGTDASFLARFQREAQAAAQLNHPNVVAVFDYGQDPVGPYIVMELVTGGTSRVRCASGDRCHPRSRRASDNRSR